MDGSQPKIAFAGDRDISVWVLQKILDSGIQPLALLTSAPDRASHAEVLRGMCPFLDDDAVLTGKAFREHRGIQFLSSLELDWIICVHFPYLVPRAVIDLTKQGVINLHPAFLPFNRGWHTPTWALLEGTPVGATLHFMDEGIDTGDIIHQRELKPTPSDTADTLYARLKKLEYEVFCEAWPSLMNGTYQRHPQPVGLGSIHRKEDLFKSGVQRIDLDTPQTPRSLLNRLRALSTNDLSEAAFFEQDGKIYRVQVQIVETQEKHENDETR
jgi:methionyl-tRNA formyltransferase